MKGLTVRTVLALLLGLTIAACENGSPTSPTSRTLGPSASGAGTVGALDKPDPGNAGLPCPDNPAVDRDEDGHCHGDDTGDEPTLLFSYQGEGDLIFSPGPTGLIAS